MQFRRQNLAFFVISSLVFAILLFSHEPWRDEAQSFLLSTKAPDLGSLWTNTSYEAFRSLWFFLLFLVSRFTHDLFVLKIVGFVLGIFGFFLLYFRVSIADYRLKALFGLSYFTIFEYGVIVRSYSLIFPIICTFLISFDKSRSRAQQIFLHVGSLWILSLISAPTFLYLYLPLLSVSYLDFFQRKGKEFLWTLVPILFLPMLVTVPPDLSLEIRPLPASVNQILSELSNIILVLFPFPELKPAFWNTSLFSSYPLVVIVIFCIFLFTTKGSRMMTILLFGLGLTTFFTMFAFPGEIRHRGHFLILFVTLVFLYWNQIAKSGRQFIVLFLLSGVGALGIAASYSYRYPFSCALEVSRFIQKSFPISEERIIAGIPDYTMAPIAAALQEEIYMPSVDRRGSFVLWNSQRKTLTVKQQAEHFFVNEKKFANKNIIFISNFNLMQGDLSDGESAFEEYEPVNLLCTTAVIPSEKYYVFVKKKKENQ